MRGLLGAVVPVIFDAIIGVCIALLTGVLAVFPSFNLSGSMSSFGASIGSSVAAANGVFPVITLGACMVAIVAVRLFQFAFVAIVWLYDRIPFKAT